MKIAIYIIIAIVFFGIGYFIEKYTIDSTYDKTFNLDENIILYQAGEKIGELYKGAILKYEGGMDEGFHRASLLMDYYQKPDSLKYYHIKQTQEVNLQIPCWNDRDVTPIDTSS